MMGKTGSVPESGWHDMLMGDLINECASVYREITDGPLTDNLTGLYNHGFFQVLLDQKIENSKNADAVLTLGLLDLDAFQLFNIQFGPMESDRVLKEFSILFKEHFRDLGIPARLMGDQFAVLFFQKDFESAWRIAEKFRQTVADSTNQKLTVSIGLASASIDKQFNKETFVNQAYKALKEAKSSGRNCVCCNQPACCQPLKQEMYQAFEGNILVVDDEPFNLKLLEALLKPMGYKTSTATNGMDALFLAKKLDFDLILLDVMMPSMDGFEACRQLKSSEETRLTPVILITALNDTESKIKGIEAGADDFLGKPPSKPELMARIRSLVRMKKMNNNLTSVENMLFSMAKAVEAKDGYTQGHVDRVARLALALGGEIGLSESELVALKYGGGLHDIGKLAVSETILNKPGPLTPSERVLMESHPVIGYEICLPLKKNLGAALDVIRHHHEKLDGSGYPDRLQGDEISRVARVMAVADMFDALSTDRPYRQAMPQDEAMSVIFREVEEGKLDRNVVDALANILPDYVREGFPQDDKALSLPLLSSL
jgi:putative two-component system response regulator